MGELVDAGEDLLPRPSGWSSVVIVLITITTKPCEATRRATPTYWLA
ncbi:MAG: hypothetical protein QM733_20410 [Ilumatobacteraceae bacterium]